MTNRGWRGGRGRVARQAGLLCLALAVSVAILGCGGGANLAPLTGKVTFKGAPVTGGFLTFNPVGTGQPGKPATAEVKEDGTYAAQTNTPGDGALIGKHTVSYLPPEVKLPEGQKPDTKKNPPPPPYMGLTPKQSEVEVKSGSNTIDIELVPKAGKKN